MGALARALSTHFSDKAAFVLGMDSNTSDSDAFSAALESCGIMAEEASDPAARTVAKRRSRLQTQVKKAGVLDVSLKDFVVASGRRGRREDGAFGKGRRAVPV